MPTQAFGTAVLDEPQGSFRIGLDQSVAKGVNVLFTDNRDIECRTKKICRGKALGDIAGTLGVIDIEKGAYLDGTTPVTRLSDLSSVEVQATLPERYFESVTPGRTLQVTTPAYPGETFEGRITLRAPEIDRDTRSFEIRAEIANADRRLAGGMFANSRLLLGSHDGIAIPDAAIISEGLTSYVYTVADGTATRVDIDPGKSLGELTEVRGRMALGDRVVVAGWDQLSDGTAVSIEGSGAQEATG